MSTVSILSLVTTSDTSSTQDNGDLPDEGNVQPFPEIATVDVIEFASVPLEPTTSNPDEPSAEELRGLAEEELVRLGMMGQLGVEDILSDDGSVKALQQKWRDRRQAELAKKLADERAAKEKKEREDRDAQAQAERERQERLVVFRKGVANSRPVTGDELKEWIGSRVAGQVQAIVEPKPTKKEKSVKTVPTSKRVQKPAVPAIPEAVVAVEKQVGEKFPVCVFKSAGFALAMRGLLIGWIKPVQDTMRRNASNEVREYEVALQQHIGLVNQIIKVWGKEITDRSTSEEFDHLRNEIRQLPAKHNIVLLSGSQTWIAAAAEAKAVQEQSDAQAQAKQAEAELLSKKLQEAIDLLVQSSPGLSKDTAGKLAAHVLRNYDGDFRRAADAKTELAKTEQDMEVAVWYSNAADLQKSLVKK